MPCGLAVANLTATWGLGHKHQKKILMWACLDRNLFSGKSWEKPSFIRMSTPDSAFGNPSHRLHRIAGIDHQSMSRTYGYIHRGIGQDLSFLCFTKLVSPSSYVRGYIHIIHYADGAGWELAGNSSACFVRDSATV